MKRYLAYTGRMAAAAPPSRNRIVDFWRVVALVMVVCGHWLIASIWIRPDGSRALMNSLEWIPYASWVTWLAQVMPVFFLVGGYANARALARVIGGEQPRRDWITRRARRLFAPVVPLLLVWSAGILVMREFVSPGEVQAGVIMATMPVWFLAVYLVLSALAPFTHAWWRRRGAWSLGVLAAASVGVDVARFAFGVPVVGWLNFVFVWVLVHQVGYWWAARDDRGGTPRLAGWPLAFGSLGVLIAVTWSGMYPVAMISIPGQGVANMTPPTFALALLAGVQFGIILGTQRAVGRLVAGARAWHAVVALSGVAMTMFLWHLTAMMLTVGAGLFAFDGAAFRVEPGTTLWWATRPLWFLAVGLATLPFVALLARFEWRISQAPAPVSRVAVALGVVLTAGACAATVTLGMADRLGQWLIPVAALAGAAILRALPARPKGLSARLSGPVG